MKRPQKVTPESRLNQYARKMYGKEKFEKQWDEDYETESLTGKKGDKKKIRTALNRKLRHSRKQDLSLIHISEPTRPQQLSRMPSSA